jgi:hypothetical protein
MADGGVHMIADGKTILYRINDGCMGHIPFAFPQGKQYDITSRMGCDGIL